MEENKILDNFNEETDDIENVGTRLTYTLKKPVKYGETEIKALNIDFDKLTGKDSRAISRELQTLGITVLVPTLSEEYLVRVVVRACEEKIGADFFDNVSMYDFNKLTGRAKAFLLKSEL